ncbi:MAG: xanthine dehydrogenase family protein molybdopterin-binding subunit [Deltaproteobacteria bacterium]
MDSALQTDHGQSALGRSIPRREGAAKLCGKACYVDDLPRHGVWSGGTVRADVPHALLRGIRFDPRFDWGRVVVVTAADIPGENVVPVVLRDQPALVEKTIRYYGEPVALIAAPDKETLQRALASVQLETSPLEPVFDPDEALAGNVLVFESDNVFRTIRICKGDVASAFSSADVVIQQEYCTGSQEHVYLEPQGMQAEPTEDGITLRGSTQCPYCNAEGVALLLALPAEKVRVVACTTGGGFGGKEDFPTLVAEHAALLAWKARRPVRLIYSRVEDMRYTSKRHPARVRHKTGWMRDGRLVAMQIELDHDGGAYSTLSPLILQRAAVHAAGTYQCDHMQITARAIATNHPPRGAFRGFGAPQSLFALETHIDYCAAKLGLDPIEVRRRNLVRPGGTLATGQKVGQEAASGAVLERALTESNFVARRAEYTDFNRRASVATGLARFPRRGVGLALFMHGTGLNGNSERDLACQVLLRGNADGTVSVLTAQVEIGQGARTVLAQLAAEGLGIPVDWITVEEPDTAAAPNSGPTCASRTTSIVGGLVISAGRQLRSEVARRLGAPIADPLALRAAIARFAAREPLEVRTSYRPPPDMHWDDEAHQGDVYLTYTWSCCVVALEVDTLTGEVKVLDAIAIQDVGKLAHPLFAAGQVEGGVTQGLGWALMENVVCSNGVMQNATMTDYSIPTAADIPPIRAVFLEQPHNRSPHGAKGLGELPMEGPAPAVVNALRQALGIHFNQVPVTPEVILAAWEERDV